MQHTFYDLVIAEVISLYIYIYILYKYMYIFHT